LVTGGNGGCLSRNVFGIKLHKLEEASGGAVTDLK
jgi:hypothetical protein